MNGHGCPKCLNLKWGHSPNRDTEGFIKKFKEIHGENYDYSLAESIVSSKSKITVLCSTHGAFSITPDNHMQGKGCPSCARSGFKPHNAGVFYILKITEDVIKFGITSDLGRRLKQIQRDCSFDISVLFCFEFESGQTAKNIEDEIYKDKTITRQVVSKLDMRSGYAETTYISSLPIILGIVDKYKPD